MNLRKQKELLDQTRNILQMAMVRLQEELIYTLTQNQQCFDHGYVPLRICEENHIYEESIVSVKHDSVQNASRRESSSTETEEYVLDLLHPDMIPQIKSIANIMFASRYDQEFCQAFIGFGRCAFTVYMKILNVEELSIEDVLKMEWKCLNSRIRKWGLAMKNFIGLYLANAKHLFDQVLGEYGHISLTCLIEASKASVMCLLNFGHAVAIGPHRPEWLYCLLDMYEVLAALIPDVDALFPEDIGSFIRIEFYDLLTRLADSAKVIFKELENYIGSISSTRPWANGGIHPLTKYVINYILANVDLEQNLSGPVAAQVQSLTSVLEANLDNMSNLYSDSSLKHIFLLNNIHYMVEKIRNSKLRTYFGDEWVKSHSRKFQWHAMSYQRYTWSSILSLLRYDWNAGRATLKARCRDFTLAFNDVYKNQTGFCVPNIHLRQELRISASITVVQAYRTFLGIKAHTIGEKHIKYSAHDLENYIMDLYEGSSKSVNHSRKR
ncbi:hypothetical protein Pfo_031388 [Paulownia fortunei]|nr:hypothetical protein Pfo_031388 [Paulownia fortunei]